MRKRKLQGGKQDIAGTKVEDPRTKDWIVELNAASRALALRWLRAAREGLDGEPDVKRNIRINNTARFGIFKTFAPRGNTNSLYNSRDCVFKSSSRGGTSLRRQTLIHAMKTASVRLVILVGTSAVLYLHDRNDPTFTTEETAPHTKQMGTQGDCSTDCCPQASSEPAVRSYGRMSTLLRHLCRQKRIGSSGQS